MQPGMRPPPSHPPRSHPPPSHPPLQFTTTHPAHLTHPLRTHGSPSPPAGEWATEDVKRSIDLSIGIIVAILNIIEIILIARIKRKKKNYEIMLLSLSVADLLFGLSNGVVCIMHLSNVSIVSSTGDILHTTYFFFVLTSIAHLTYIAVERVWAIVKPIKHNIFMTRKRLYKILVAIWITTAVASITLYVLKDRSTTFKKHIATNNIQTNNTSQIRTINNFTNPSYVMGPGNMSNASRKPPTGKPDEGIYKTFMQKLLSYFIIIADVFLVGSYAYIIYRVQGRKQSMVQNDQVSIVCILVAGIFVIFTIPYAIHTLAIGNANLWVNIMLVSNSALNCIVYFFRGRCEKEKNQKKNKYGANSNSSAMTPIPLASRQNLSKDSPMGSRLNLDSPYLEKKPGGS